MKLKKIFLFTIIFFTAASFIFAQEDFIRGFDASYVLQVEKNGGIYKTSSGKEEDLFKILKDSGINLIRLRLWNTDESLEDMISLAQRAKSYGLKFMLDFHYSPTWADYGTQIVPCEWENFTSPEQLSDAVFNYTDCVLKKLKDLNIQVDYVQIGNEIDNGLLLKKADGSSYLLSCKRKSQNINSVLSAASQAVRKNFSDCKIVIHLASMQWLDWVEDFFDPLVKKVDFDVLAFSYYPFYDQGTLAVIEKNIKALKKHYKKDVLIAETSYAWTLDYADDNMSNLFYTKQEEISAEHLVYSNKKLSKSFNTKKRNGITYIEASKENQSQLLQELIKICQNAGSIGLCYWGGEWISAGNFASNWENQALFDFEGNALPALNVLGSYMTNF